MPVLLVVLQLAAGHFAKPLDAPIVDPLFGAATRDAPAIEGHAPSAVKLLAAVNDAPSNRQFPRFSLVQYLRLFGSTFGRFVKPQPSDAWVYGVMLGGSALAFLTDIQTHRAIQEIPDPEIFPGWSLASIVSLLGEGWVDLAVFVGLGLFGGRDGRRAAIAGLTALAVAGLIARTGKLVFRRERPQSSPDKDVWFSSRTFQADSFPSGHALCAFATAAVLASEYPKLSVLWYGLAAWVGLARIQVSTHWLSDVIVGGALGLLIGWEAWRVTRALEIEIEPWLGAEGAGLAVAKTF